MEISMNKELLKRYEGYEHENGKFFNDEVVAVLFWILSFLVCGFALCFGLAGKEDGFGVIGFSFCMFYVVLMSMWQRARFILKEKNVTGNIYEKLMFSPVNLKMYMFSRIWKMSKYYMLYAVVLQLVAIVIHLLYHGGFKLIWETFIPLYGGVVAVIVYSLLELVSYGDCVKCI